MLYNAAKTSDFPPKMMIKNPRGAPGEPVVKQSKLLILLSKSRIFV